MFIVMTLMLSVVLVLMFVLTLMYAQTFPVVWCPGSQPLLYNCVVSLGVLPTGGFEKCELNKVNIPEQKQRKAI